MKGEELQASHSFSFLHGVIINVYTEGHTVAWLGISPCFSNNVKSYGRLKTPEVFLK